ncbi:MAG TPA: alpha/beta hydrolase [Phycisphaerae bacterium]|nr:alpha/beta hydrolase [Phycisphaerae bacterium]
MLYFLQSRLVYWPDRRIEATPRKVGLAYQDVTFTSEDGVKLSGWHVPAPNHRGTVLFCHGNGGNISHRLESIEVFHRLGLSVFIFDYRGYGQSEGSPSEEGTFRDAEAAWQYVVGPLGDSPDDVVVFGRSLGGAVAAHLARSRTARALIVESAFTSVPDFAAEKFWFLPARWMSRFSYATVEYVRDVRCPVLVVHSRDDELIPFHHGQTVFEAASQPKEFLEINGTHNEGFVTSGERYRRGIDAFVTQHLSAGTQPSTRGQ